jgi:D-amino-acid dehydrogenase
LKVAVIGAGIVGVTTAHELTTDGHAVTVFERRSSVAAETSFANAGVLAPGYVTPWAAPGMPGKVLGQLWGQHAAVRLAGTASLALAPWVWRWWRACRPEVHQRNRAAMQALAHYSRQRLLAVSQRHHLEFEQSRGYLVLLRSARELASAQRSLALLHEWGVAHQLLDAAKCRALEPGLNPQTALAGAIHLADDGVGNCRQFAHLLKAEAQRLGTTFRLGHEVLQVAPGPSPRVDWRSNTGTGSAAFDAVVVCAGVDANDVLQACGIRLPLAAVHGYSITATLRENEAHPVGPVSAVMDERYKVAISRLGQRVRVAGSAELGGSLDRINASAVATLYHVLNDWFPGAAQLRGVQPWKGARPMLPDGPPVLGACRAPGVWLNLGHGSSGWALACGSARVLADQVAGRTPEIDVAGLRVERVL